MSFGKFFSVSFLTAVLIFSGNAGEIKIKSGEKIAFLGDSITRLGVSSAGYVTMIKDVFEANGIKAVVVPAGISGHKSNDMLKRLDSDVLSKNVQIMALSCGVNDVWHGDRGVPLNEYKKNITEIINRAQKKGVRVYIMTATMIRENPNNDYNKQLAPYNDFLRKIAAEKNCVLVDQNSCMQSKYKELRKKYPRMKGNFLTYDGVHMNARGNMMMATVVLKALGFSDAQIAKALPVWMKRYYGISRVSIPVEDFMKLSEKAYAANVDVPTYIRNLVLNDLKK